MSNNALLEKLLDEEEGTSAHVYPDSRGLMTIARGCLVDRSVPCEGLCAEAITAQNAHDTARIVKLAAQIPGYFQANEIRQTVVQSMCFQLGDLRGWPGFKAAFAAGNYALAADNMLYSDVSDHTKSGWDKQTSRRCEREAAMMRSGEWVDR